ncbi:MAG: enoyl-CoA hydratase/isomerase family protein [Chloroflexota bacterium]
MHRPPDGSDELILTRTGAIQWVIFNRPHARNAMTWAMYDGLAQACREVNEDPSVRAVVLTGAGGQAFVAGTDIGQFRAFNSPRDALDYEANGDRVMDAIESVRVPTIAAIAGPCTGGGAGIAACCDIRVASPSARYGFPIARTLGNCLSLRGYARQVALLGIPRVKDLLLTARLVSAPEMLSWGVVSEVTDTEEALLPRAHTLAELIAGNAPLTLQVTKRALRLLRDRLLPEMGDPAEADLILTCYQSRDFKEGVEAFLAKRPPRWVGE